MIREHIFMGSSNVESARYNQENKTLDVWFKKGAPYRYFYITEKKFEMWMVAESAGGFLSKEIARRHEHPCVRLACGFCAEVLDLTEPFNIYKLVDGTLRAYHPKCSSTINAQLFNPEELLDSKPIPT
jgi:hypothetical protein